MAATNSSSGSKNFYNLSYGYLSTRVKNLPMGVDKEVTQEGLKSKMQKHENLDLRASYVDKGGEYPFQVFYQRISGTIMGVDSKEVQGIGKLLEITMLDEDNELSTITTRLYGKYSENFLNRFLNLEPAKVTIAPYSIPSEFTAENGVIKYYNQGVVIYDGEGKLIPKYSAEELPPKDMVKDANGSDKMANFTRVDKLLQEVKGHVVKFQTAFESSSAEVVSDMEEEDDDLPF